MGEDQKQRSSEDADIAVEKTERAAYEVQAAPEESKDDPKAQQANALVQVAVNFLMPILQVIFNGVMVSSQQWCPPDKMLVTLCRCLGVVVGNSTSAGGIQMALRMRRMCLDAFEEGVKSVTPQNPITMPPSLDIKAALKNGGASLNTAIVK